MILRKKIFFKNFIVVAGLAFGGLLAMDKDTGTLQYPYYKDLEEFAEERGSAYDGNQCIRADQLRLQRQKDFAKLPGKIPNTQADLLCSVHQSKHLELINTSDHKKALHKTFADIMSKEVAMTGEGFDPFYHAYKNTLYGGNKIAMQIDKLNNELTGQGHLNDKINMLLLRSNISDSCDEKFRKKLKEKACKIAHDKNYINRDSTNFNKVEREFDLEPKYSTHLLSCNASLAGSHLRAGNSSLTYFINNNNHSDQKRDITEYFEKKDNILTKQLKKYIPDMEKAIQRFSNASASGTMLQIGIKDTNNRAMLDDLSYPSAAYGFNLYEWEKANDEHNKKRASTDKQQLEQVLESIEKPWLEGLPGKKASISDKPYIIERINEIDTALKQKPDIEFLKKSSSFLDKIEEEARSKKDVENCVAPLFQARLLLVKGAGGLLNPNDPDVHNNVVMNAYTTTKTGEGIDAQEEFHKDVDHIMNKVKYGYQKEQRRNYWWNKAKNFILPAIKLPSTTIPDKPVNPHAYKPGMAITVPFWKKTFDYHKNKQMGMTEQYKPVETTNPFS
jgi:hypothetical protein